MTRLLLVVAAALVVVLAAAGVGDADEVNVTLKGHFGGTTYAVVASGNYTYVGQGQDFAVLDISDPVASAEVGRVRIDGIVRDIAVSGDYAYVADSRNGLSIVDISDPSSPALTGQYDTVGGGYVVTVSGDYVYIGGGSNRLVILHVAPSDTPQKGDLNSDDILTPAIPPEQCTTTQSLESKAPRGTSPRES